MMEKLCRLEDSENAAIIPEENSKPETNRELIRGLAGHDVTSRFKLSESKFRGSEEETFSE